ncbi:hypothetical protein KHC33_16710 [Methanospirillum sp. J.3.6.1-F.2.7.3]|jgi:hypothetical protein|uniref:Uncharacterized protein n=1 Tax=Methanospirillum purgamenti TaxID=2834276 RepID=A0A8E7EJX9_9EURY|nr:MULTISPECIES: hypothetical protein [Methanospirillum]MDX8549532.1 hypothetical protein [Methanospirillum hungatei]QVV88920.1 hypothetical protein KHC33_16710 [Methanospirillum sp. J.3.6.1-F.2.7.3]
MVKHGVDVTLSIPYLDLMTLGTTGTLYRITIYTYLVSDRDIEQISTKTIGISNELTF